MAKEYKYKSSNARYRELSNGFMPTGEYWEKVRQEDEKWNKYLQRQRELQQGQPLNQQPWPTTKTQEYIYNTGSGPFNTTPANQPFNNTGRNTTYPTNTTGIKRPGITNQGQLGAASMATEYGGRPKTKSLSDLEREIAELSEQAKNAQDRALSIDRNLDPMGAAAAREEFKSLDEQIKELERQRDELAAANNSSLTQPQEPEEKYGGNTLVPDNAASGSMEVEDIEDADLLSRMESNTKINGENGERIRSIRNEINNLQSEISSLNDQGAAILNDPNSMNMATAGYATASQQFNTIRGQVEEKQKKLGQLQEELKALEREEALNNNKYMPGIEAKYGSKGDNGNGQIIIGGNTGEVEPYNYSEGTH